MNLDLTIAIPVKNEEKNLSNCLKAIGEGLAKKIVLIDSGSTDQTKEIALEYGVSVIDFVWDGKFPKKRNWYLRNHTPQTKWVLFLDADEHLTDAFKKELRQAILKDNKVGYWLSYTVYFMGKKLKGGDPLRKLALFKVGAGEYEKIDENEWSQLDMEVHEHPILNGPIGSFKSKIDHKDLRDVSFYIRKHNEYASWETARYLCYYQQKRKDNKWTFKQRLKYRLMRTSLIGPVYFLWCFILLGGFRDGAKGLAFAILKMSYFTQIYCKIQEKQA
ncbi:MAG TPA: glycosyltransferase family 2 protein [Flavisolibacter sp.]|nr:glycosyltransferase family 2 protein [Flavisolibacter sp.]